jgi:hypothetical protein
LERLEEKSEVQSEEKKEEEISEGIGKWKRQLGHRRGEKEKRPE